METIVFGFLKFIFYAFLVGGSAFVGAVISGLVPWIINLLMRSNYTATSEFERNAGMTMVFLFCYLWPVVFGLMCSVTVLKQLMKEDEPPVVVKTEIRRYKLLDYNPPKHFYVDLQDIETGQVYNHTYVSKHCNSHRNNVKGDEFNIKVIHKKRGDKEYIEFDNLYEVFCG